MDLGLTERQFWNCTLRELAAFYRAQATKEARWRFYMATSMGAKHTSGRPLKLDDFLPEKQLFSGPADWKDLLGRARGYVDKSNRLRSMAGKVVSEQELAGLIN